jgi:hypothetical protein
MSINLNPLSFLRQAIKAVPAVKYALGVGGIIAVIAIIYSFKIDIRVAFVGAIGMLLLMVMLVIFARVSALRGSALRVPAMAFTWFTLVLFMATAVLLFTSIFFQRPIDLTFWITGEPAILDIPVADSGWVGGGSSPGQFCGPVLKGYQAKYPRRTISLVNTAENHKDEYTPFKRDYYRYQCWFKAS